LYLKERELATNITSICLHSDFLLATTLDHRLDQKYNLLKGRVKTCILSSLNIGAKKRINSGFESEKVSFLAFPVKSCMTGLPVGGI
jgi:hypothetical protein